MVIIIKCLVSLGSMKGSIEYKTAEGQKSSSGSPFISVQVRALHFQAPAATCAAGDRGRENVRVLGYGKCDSSACDYQRDWIFKRYHGC